MRIKKGDTVVVRAGDDSTRKTTTVHKVISVLAKEGKLIVEGVNRVVKHMKPSKRNRQGGRLTKEMPVPLSKVMLFCPDCKGGVRVGAVIKADGSKVRICRKCKNELGTIGRPKTKAKA